MLTDLDSGNPWQNQYVSAYYLLGNDEARDNNGTVLPRLPLRAGLHSTLWVLDRVRAFARELGKKLLFLLSYGADNGMAPAKGKPIADALVLERLRALPDPFIDLRDHHAADYRDFSCGVDAYCKRYWNGHYGPRGNHFFAHAIKDAVVRWLEPKPVAYRDNGHAVLAAVARMTGGATVGGGSGR
jgi:hypothetical protein